MAPRATVHKAQLHISDIDRNYYGSHLLTIVRAPSETEDRMMARLLAFALNADEALALAGDMAETEEASLWKKDLEGRIELWIEVGLPEPKRLKKASGRSKRVLLYLYHGRQAGLWLDQNRKELQGIRNLDIVEIEAASMASLAALADKSMDFQVTIQDGHATFAHGEGIIEIELRRPGLE